MYKFKPYKLVTENLPDQYKSIELTRVEWNFNDPVEYKKYKDVFNELLYELDIAIARFKNDGKSVNRWSDKKLLKWLQTTYDDTKYVVFLYKMTETIVGTIVLRFYNFNNKKTPWVMVSQIVVHPKYRKMGFGGFMMQDIFAYLKNLRIDKLYLDVLYKNIPAYAFYKEMGFEEEYVSMVKIL